MSELIRPARASTPPPAAFAATPLAEAGAAAAAHAPYLARLIKRRSDLLHDIDEGWPQRMLDSALADARAVAEAPPLLEDAMSRLRRAKQAAHLAVALADLARLWPLARITGALSDFADATLRAALAVAVRERSAAGDLSVSGASEDRGPVPGLCLVAMGKMGAGELNYSSDIDFSVFFDAGLLAQVSVREPRVTAVRLVSPLVRVLEEITEDGYVFRTDLRLRPDPGATPVAVSISAAEHYYQNLGQNWERAAFIKARAAAGDRALGGAFLSDLEPFIWRKHLDFAAVEDVHSIKRQILSTHKSAELSDPVFDVKLGRGGIRDIELFAQTQQLILGGRNRKLRASGTVAALAALVEAGAISQHACESLTHAYRFFRDVEHRVQMLEDAQTHKIPRDAETRARVAALAGFESLAALDAALVDQRRTVSEIDHQLFGRGESLADPMGSLIFTGVEDHPETLATIAKLGYADPTNVSATVRGWHHGRVRAMRSERARELLTRLTPKLLRTLAEAGDPDLGFARFSAFFANLTAGVQVLALLEARPGFLALLARVFALAPSLSEKLARRPALMDALIEQRFGIPLREDRPGARLDELRARLAHTETFEARLNEARRFHREEAFRISVQVVEGVASAREAGAAHADLAEACVAAMADAAVQEVERTHGRQLGAFTILALGKFGGCELAEGSDLDIMLVYDTPSGSDGSAAPSDFYTRVTQRLISALSAQTEEGALYEIDTKLRPSGSKGPVAVRLSSFERYYESEAWTWEMQSLTRLRPVAGDASLSAKVAHIAHAALTRPRDAARTLVDVADMRGRMEHERRARTVWDFKLAAGGLVDIEFIAQALQLVHGHRCPQIIQSNTGAALAALAEVSVLDAATYTRLTNAWTLWSDLQQVLRICVSGDFDPESAPAPLRTRLAAVAGEVDLSALATRVEAAQAAVRSDFVRLVGPLNLKV